MNYKLKYSNYIENGIVETDEEVDNKTIFKYFGEAKNILINVLTMGKS